MKKVNSNLEGYIKNIIGNLELEIDFDSEIQGLSELKNDENELQTLALSDYQVKDEKNNDNIFILVSDWKTGKPTSNEIKEAIVTELKKCPKNTATKSIIHVLYRVKNIETKINRENVVMPVVDGKRSFQMSKQIKSECKAHLNIKTISVKFICDTILEANKIELTEIRRFNMLNMPETSYFFNNEDNKEDKKTQLNGYVLTIPLAQLVKIYNQVGDVLFKNNVRYGIDDFLGVDEAIRNTLKEAPGTFWFKNNGVTIIINDNKFSLDKSSKITLYNPKHKDEQIEFSVVNGAQTITAAADLYYELACSSDASDKEKLKKYESEAKVLLRLIHVAETKDKKDLPNNVEVEEISVALNRQKPILAEDIAFSAPQITDLIRISQKTKLNIIKRGQKNSENGISLDELARYRKAVMLKPGSARNTVAKKLLKLDSDRKLSDELFPDWSKGNSDGNTEYMQEEDMLKAYYKSYKWILFVHELILRSNSYISKLKNKKSNVGIDNNVKAIIMNGKWYLVCSVLECLFKDEKLTKEEQFTAEQLSELAKIYNKSNWDTLIEEYAKCLNEVLQDDEFKKAVSTDLLKAIDSNLFKSDTLFEELEKNKELNSVKKLNSFIQTRIDKLRGTDKKKIEEKIEEIELKDSEITVQFNRNEEQSQDISLSEESQQEPKVEETV